MARMTRWFRWTSVAITLTCGAPAARSATLVTYADNLAGFVANTSATSIGNLTTLGPVNSRTVGGVTITTNSGSLYFNDFSPRVPNREMIISAEEDFTVTLPGGIYSMGMDIFEPTFGGGSGCNTSPCVDTQFSIEILAGATSLGVFPYNAPDDVGTGPVALGFFGVHSDVAFNKVVVRDLTANADNEMFANFLTGTGALIPTPTLSRTWGTLKVAYR